MPHIPQFEGSVARFAQKPAHDDVPGGQLVAHLPPTQTSPGMQRVPHAPQFDGSRPRSTQAPEHREVGGAHAQMLA
ncbi:MAG: hypothetical protein WCJ30_11285 [Deltaproteobacteria bacterium]